MRDFRSFDQESYPRTAQVRRLKLKRVRKGRLFLTTVFIFAVVMLAVYAFSVDLWSLAAEIYFDSRSVAGGAEKQVHTERKWLNVLLVGVDQRKNEPARSDTLMVAMFNMTEKKVYVISIPRDTRVKIEGLEHPTRINHAHSNGGIELTRKTVEEFLGIPVHNYVETNFDGFENIIDMIGGINLDVEKNMYYPAEGIDVREGYQCLDGHDALGYVRYRNDGGGDLPRIERQHKFLAALTKEVMQPGTLLKIPDIARKMHSNVKTDMSVKEIILLAGRFKDTGTENIKFINIPGSPKYIYGASYYVVDEVELQIFIDEIITGAAGKNQLDNNINNNEEIVSPERDHS
ncbi:LCP family protein [Phosphitispora sp. TUW77]|uniref:LCP family protein n=1 Tax=Phosphitispora sp. TUW77 TaxID=3152361 RepID=UPI003AB5A4A2